MLLNIEIEFVEKLLCHVVEQAGLHFRDGVDCGGKQCGQPDHRRPSIGKLHQAGWIVRRVLEDLMKPRRSTWRGQRGPARTPHRRATSFGLMKLGRTRLVNSTCACDLERNASTSREGEACAPTSSYSSMTSHVSRGHPSRSSAINSAMASGSSSGVLNAARSSRTSRSTLEERGANASARARATAATSEAPVPARYHSARRPRWEVHSRASVVFP